MKENYDKKMTEICESLDTGTPILLHSCCAPCSSACLERLKERFEISVLYYNPNIDDEKEYEKRKAEQVRFLSLTNGGVLVDCEHDKRAFIEMSKGLENEPERLAEIKGISQRMAKEISQEFMRQFAMRKVLIELENYGITPSESTSIYKYFGVGAINTIRQNPYVLCNMDSSFSFDRVEELVQTMQLSPDPSYRNTAGILHVIRHNLYNNGHTCLPRRKLIAPCASLLDLTEDEVEIALDSMLTGHLLYEEMLANEPFLFLPDIYMAENSIAERMRTILKFPPAGFSNMEKELDESEERNGLFYAPAQREAV